MNIRINRKAHVGFSSKYYVGSSDILEFEDLNGLWKTVPIYEDHEYTELCKKEAAERESQRIAKIALSTGLTPKNYQKSKRKSWFG